MGRIRRRAAAVIRFIDTVTQAPVSGSSLYIQIKQKNPILWKEDGYVVIMEQPGVDSLDIFVSGGRFSPAWFHMDVLRDAPVQICYAHLLPASGYPFTKEMAVIRGTCPLEGLYAVRMADAGRYRLMEDLTGGENRIRIWGNESFSPGQQLLLNEGQRYEPVMLLAEDEETEYGYHIRGQLKGKWKKGKTKIYSAIRIFPDEKGEFCVAYTRISKGGEKIRFLGGNYHLREEETTTAGGTVTKTADDTTTDTPIGTIGSTVTETVSADGTGTKTADSTAIGTSTVTAAGKVTCTEVEIQEGQEIEIHVGG